MTNIAGCSDADLPAQSVFVLWRVLSEMCCSVHRRRPPPELGAGPTAPDVWNDGGKLRGGRRSCTISDTLMWATWGTQHMNAASPVSVLARGSGNGFKAWRRKLNQEKERKREKERERDNCHSSSFDLFDFYALKYCFSLFVITSVRWR